jgi:hypothetical protein
MTTYTSTNGDYVMTIGGGTGTLTVNGDFDVVGNMTAINSNVVTINDKVFVVANNQSTSAGVDGAGLAAGGGTPIATWTYTNIGTAWTSNVNINPVANLFSSLGNPQKTWAEVYAGNVIAQIVSSSVGVSAPLVGTTATLFGSLPPTPPAGTRAFVTDANTATFGSQVSGGAGNSVPVYSNGTNWYVG